MNRINHVSWWERELPSENKMEIGLNNLQKKTDYRNWFLVICMKTRVFRLNMLPVSMNK